MGDAGLKPTAADGAAALHAVVPYTWPASLPILKVMLLRCPKHVGAGGNDLLQLQAHDNMRRRSLVG